MFIKTFLLSLFFSFIFWFSLIWGQTDNPTLMSQWVYDVYHKKETIAKSIKGKKIVIVAGSNALFGIDSKRLSDYFNLPIVNFGVNAGVELPLILYKAKKVINPNDIVIAPLEYPMYSYSGEIGIQMIDYLLSREPSFFWKLSIKEQFYILWHTTFARIIDGYIYKGGETIRSGVFGVHNIDKYGDQIKTNNKYKESYMYKEIKNYKNNPEKYGKSFKKDSIGWDYLKEFINWSKDKNVTVIFMPSALMKHSSYYKNPIEYKFYKDIGTIVQNRGWNYIGDPFDYMYNSSYHFNTNFHLTDRGRVFNTNKIIIDLKKTNIK
jgi:hypothetical protein